MRFCERTAEIVRAGLAHRAEGLKHALAQSLWLQKVLAVAERGELEAVEAKELEDYRENLRGSLEQIAKETNGPILQHAMPALRACFDGEGRKAPKLTLTVATDGSVARAEAPQLPPGVADCVATVTRRMRFSARMRPSSLEVPFQGGAGVEARANP